MSYKRKYGSMNVYDAARERIKFVFDNFERVYVSMSGGKDSGVLLNLAMDYMREKKESPQGDLFKEAA